MTGDVIKKLEEMRTDIDTALQVLRSLEVPARSKDTPVVEKPKPQARKRSGHQWSLTAELMPWSMTMRARFHASPDANDRDAVFRETFEATAENGEWLPARVALVLALDRTQCYQAMWRMRGKKGTRKKKGFRKASATEI